MARNKNAEYWRGRSEQLEEASHQAAYSTYKDVEKTFQQAQYDLQAQIDKWIVRMADNNGVSFEEAKRMLNQDELEEFHWNVKEYIKKGEENAVDQRWMKQLENASAKVHIQRLEALKIDTQNTLENAYAIYNSSVDDLAKNIYEDGYYKTAYMLAHGTGAGAYIQAIDQRKLANVITKPWAVDGKNFSDRIWEDKEKTINGVHQALTRAAVMGGSPDAAIKSLEPYVKSTIKNKKYAAGRLVQTEQAYFHAKASLDCFSDLGVEKLEVVATLDSHTSKICQNMDGFVFDAKDAEIGVNVPPFHPNCRSVVAPYFDDETEGLRAARNPETGKTEYVPENMKYPEWKKKFVKNEQSSPISVGSPKTNLEYIKSREYRKKFDALTDDPAINDAVCKYARAVVTHQSGDYYEDIKVIDGSGKLVCSRSNNTTRYETEYTSKMVDVIKKHPRNTLISIHNHGTNLPPSGADLVAAGARGYRMGIVACHDGSVYWYSMKNAKVFRPRLYDNTVEKYINTSYNMDKVEAMKKTLRMFEKQYNIEWGEL